MRNTSLTKVRVISLLVLLFILSGITAAQPKAEVLNEWDRVDRLAGLARLWGTVKFFHPYIAYKEIDWDKALIETIPRVNAAKTPAEYEAAINHLLSFLNDKNTTATIVKETSTGDSGVKKIDRTNLVKVENGVLIIELTKIAEALAQDNSVNPDGSVGFQSDVVVPVGQQDSAMTAALQSLQNFNPGSKRTAPTATAQLSAKDKAYPEMEFPNSEYRLLALFRFWNVINYFFPYKHLIDKPWDGVLTRYIPKLEANKDALDYQTTMFELAAETQDSHVGVRNANKFIVKLGSFAPPITLKYVEKQTVVTAVFDERVSVKVGEVITSIDGEPIGRRRDQFASILPASTPQSLASRVDYSLLLGSKDSQAQLTLRGLDGTSRNVSVTRTLSLDDPKLFQSSQRTGPVVQVLPSGFGYVDLERLQVAEVNQMFETIKNTSATIFDMRGYPHGTAWEIAPRLTEKKDVGAALFSRPILEAANLSDGDLSDTRYTFLQKLPKAKGDVYKGKVVMLINEDAISQSEHTCMFFEAATDVTFIGTPTTGANGDVTTMVLPGNLVVSFSGHDVRHADGRQLQRLGIQPHVKSAPTIRGIVEKRDEVLETAVKYLQEKLSKVSTR